MDVYFLCFVLKKTIRTSQKKIVNESNKLLSKKIICLLSPSFN